MKRVVIKAHLFGWPIRLVQQDISAPLCVPGCSRKGEHYHIRVADFWEIDAD